MPGIGRSKTLKAQHREQIATLRLKQVTIRVIAEQLGISIPTVKRELRSLEAEWLEASREAVDQVKARELQKLDLLEAEAMAEWERSKKDYQRRIVEDRPSTGPNGGRGAGRFAKLESGGQTGDPRYLQVLLGISDRRAKLIGADAPHKIAPTNPDGSALSKDHRDAVMAAFASGAAPAHP